MLETIKYVMNQNVVAGIVLVMIMCGIINDPKQLTGNVNKTDLQNLSGAMEIENGNYGGNEDNDMDRLLLTGSVILNRLKSKKWNGSTIEEVILAKDGGYIQYASVTRKGFKTKKASKRTKLLAKYLLIYGSVCPENVVYQGQGKQKGTLYKAIPVKGDKDELFYTGTY